jgi:hypothetical protein
MHRFASRVNSKNLVSKQIMMRISSPLLVFSTPSWLADAFPCSFTNAWVSVGDSKAHIFFLIAKTSLSKRQRKDTRE